MPKLLYSRKSRRDLAEIWRWIAKTSGKARADEVTERLTRRIAVLESHPLIGPVRPDIGEGARLLVQERWVILYSASVDQVRIERILDGARDIKSDALD